MGIRKNIIIIFILLALLSFLMMFFNKHLLATPILLLQEQIKFLQEKLGDLLLKLSFVKKDTIPPLLSNLEPEHVMENSGIITWGSDELSNSMVIYSTEYIYKDSHYGLTPFVAVDYNWVTFHEVLLENLKPNVMYYYYVSSTDPSGNISSSNTHTIVTDPDFYK
ncbi:fibronectin type III domain-containing protein [Patescibacteria group bacterium]